MILELEQIDSHPLLQKPSAEIVNPTACFDVNILPNMMVEAIK